jgi:transcription-repair coupling factor (superfamily II helicase)
MVLPFVRDLFADAEKLPGFTRVTSHLRANTGRIRASGLNPPAKCLLISELQKAAARPVIVLVRNNEAADELVPVIQAYCELVGGSSPESIVSLPVRDVLPFQNLSPHPEIQEQRAITLWKIATEGASIVVVPVVAAASRVRPPEFYSDLARMVRRGESLETGSLLEHLNSVGYNSTDVVEMPGEYALRGGILDIYSPEADRPIRIELFGDEIESIRKSAKTCWERFMRDCQGNESAAQKRLWSKRCDQAG